jgi:uncharacterized membrane-anchored protein
MKAIYDFSRGTRGAVASSRGKTRVTIYLDNEIVSAFKIESERTGKGYQTLINEALAQSVGAAEAPLTAARLRKILREERETLLAALRAALIEGEQSGSSKPFDFEAFVVRKRKPKRKTL